MPAVAMLAIIIGLCDTIRPLLEMYNLRFLHFGSSTSDRVHHIFLIMMKLKLVSTLTKEDAEPSPNVPPKLKVPRAERSVAVVSKA